VVWRVEQHQGDKGGSRGAEGRSDGGDGQGERRGGKMRGDGGVGQGALSLSLGCA